MYIHTWGGNEVGLTSYRVVQGSVTCKHVRMYVHTLKYIHTVHMYVCITYASTYI